MCLTKGILGLLLGGLMLAFLAWDTPRLLRSPYLWGGMGLGLAPTLGWYANQFRVQDASFAQTSLVTQALRRIWTPVESHQGSPLYYLLELLEWAWPWLLFWPWGLREAWRQRDLSWGKWVWVWTAGFLGTITLMQTKLPWYVMPLYPAMAIAIGPVLADAWNRCGGESITPFSPQRLPPIWTGFVGLLGLVAMAGWVYFGFFDPNPTGDYRWPLGAIAIGSALTVGRMLQQDALFIPLLGWTWYVAIFLLMASPHWVFELNGWPAAKPLGELVQQVPAGAAVFTTDSVERPSVSFYGDRRVIPLCSVDLEAFDLAQGGYILVPSQEREPWMIKETSDASASQEIAATSDWSLIQTTPEALQAQCKI